MTNNEMNLMIAELASKCNVTQEEAMAALEAGNWNKLTAGQMLVDEKIRKAQEIEEVISNCETATAQAPAQAMEDETTVERHTDKVKQAEETGMTRKAEGVKHSESRKHCCGKGMKNLSDHIRRLVACGNRNRFVVRRNDATLLELPVTVVVVLMLFAFWACVPLLVIGLFSGCRYSFIGQDFDKAVEYIKKTAAEA